MGKAGHDATKEHEAGKANSSHPALNSAAEDPEPHEIEAEMGEPEQWMLGAAKEWVVVGELIRDDLPPMKVIG